MEYIFGTDNGRKILKTVGESHTSLSGLNSTRNEFPDMTVTDTFVVRSKYHSDTDAAGNCYDWYVLDWHSREIDRTPAVQSQVEANSAAIDEIIISLLGE